MAFIKMNLFSQALQKCVQIDVIMPQKFLSGSECEGNSNAPEKIKTLYLLHGLSDDNSVWARNTSIERYASKYGIAVVMPDGERSFYTNMVHGERFYDYIAHELPFIIENMFNVSKEREDKYIAGLSMGGYGALKISLREGCFCKCAALSAVGDIKSRLKNCYWQETAKYIFGEELNVSDEDDILYLLKHATVKPELFMAVGTSDALYNDNLTVKKTAEENGYSLKFIEAPGGHTWDFWDEYIQHALKWMLE